MGMLLLSAVVLAARPAVEVQPLSGGPVRGKLVSLGPHEVIVESAAGPVRLELAQVAGLVFNGTPAAGATKAAVWVELVDGSRIAAGNVALRSGKAAIGAESGGAVLEVPASLVRWIRFQPETQALAGPWQKLLQSEVRADLLVTRKGDVLDFYQGIVQAVGDEVVDFVLEGERIPAKRAKLYGLVFHHPAGQTLPEPLGVAVEAGGSRWPLRSIRLEGDTFHWTTPGGVSVSRPASCIQRIDFSQGKIVYLSDWKPEAAQWTPYIGLGTELPARVALFGPRPDRSLSGGPLELGGKVYAKGLALHSRTELVYRLAEPYRRFSAVAGIDDRVRPRGNVRLTVRGDGKVLFDATIAGVDPPRELDLDIRGVRRLSILVDFGEDLDVADHLDLCDARLVK